MKPKLSKAAIQLREQFDDSFPDRDRTSDGWIGDTRHAARKSDHNPDEQGWVRAIDVDKDLFKGGKPDIMGDLADDLSEEILDVLTFTGVSDPNVNSPRMSFRSIMPCRAGIRARLKLMPV